MLDNASRRSSNMDARFGIEISGRMGEEGGQFRSAKITIDLDSALAARDWATIIETMLPLPGPERTVRQANALSTAYEETGRLDLSEQAVLATAARWPNNPWLLLRLGETRIAAGKYDSAADALHRIDAREPPILVRRVARCLSMAELALGRIETGWQVMRERILADLPDNDPTLRFFQRTFATRIRTNSLFSDPFSMKHSDPAEVHRLSALIADAVVQRRPFSLIRLGDGEGNVIAGVNKALLGATHSAHGERELTDAEQAGVCDRILQACDEADVLGLAREDMDSAEYRRSITHLNPSTLERLEDGRIVLTDCHCHYALHEAGALREILSRQPFLGYVGSRDIREFASRAFPQADVVWHQTPTQHRQGDLRDEPHFPVYFQRLNQEITVPFRGAPFIVAAGVLGKVYAGWIKQRGGIAIDIGAVADLWNGVNNTRAFMELNASRLSQSRHTP